MNLHFIDDKEARTKKKFLQFQCCQLFNKDFSNNIKKIRNAISSSSTQSSNTRNLQKGSNVITWSKCIAAANWDDNTNFRRIKRKFTLSHLNPYSTNKIRNHLAEEVLIQILFIWWRGSNIIEKRTKVKWCSQFTRAI